MKYLEDPNEYEIGDTPGSVLNLMIQGMNNNQKNSDQNRNQDQSINKLNIRSDRTWKKLTKVLKGIGKGIMNKHQSHQPHQNQRI